MTRRSHRPTVAPAFDVAKYARESAAAGGAGKGEPESNGAASEVRIVPEYPRVPSKLAGETDGEPSSDAPSEVRLITRPQWGKVVTNDVWVRSVTGAPTVMMDAESLKKLPLDHRAGFILSRMDGSLDLETLVELSGMQRDYVLNLVRNLLDLGVIEFR